ATLGTVAARLIRGIDDHLHASRHHDAATITARQQPAVLVVQSHTTLRDRRRYRVFELHEPESEWIVFLAGPADVQMHVVEGIDGRDDVAGGESSAALQSHQNEPP